MGWQRYYTPLSYHLSCHPAVHIVVQSFSFLKRSGCSILYSVVMSKLPTHSICTIYCRPQKQRLTDGSSVFLPQMIYRADTGEILGVHIIGLHAADLIHEASNAIATGQTVQVKKNPRLTYPYSPSYEAIISLGCFLFSFYFASHSGKGTRLVNTIEVCSSLTFFDSPLFIFFCLYLQLIFLIFAYLNQLSSSIYA